MRRGWLVSMCRGLLGAILTVLALAGTARAQDAKTGSDWSFQITPYLWLAGMNGNVTGPRGNAASFDASIGDVLSHLDGGLMLLGEVRYKRWGLLADFDYASLTGTNGRVGPLLGQPSLKTTQYLGTLDGAYRIVDSNAFRLDGLLGVRVISLDNELSFSGGILSPRSDSGGDTWADPVAGLRAILPIGSGFVANALGDVGGGPDGDLTWQVYGGLGYNFDQTVAAYVGYRYLSMSHQNGNFQLDLNEQGPLLGVGIRF